MKIAPDPARPLEANEEIVLISDADSESKFFSLFGKPEN
jgi:hypothetical protein